MDTRFGIRDFCPAHLFIIPKNPASCSIVSKNPDACACPCLPAPLPSPTADDSLWHLFLWPHLQIILYPEKEFILTWLMKTYFSMILLMFAPTVGFHSFLATFVLPISVGCPFLWKSPRPQRHSLLVGWGVDSDSGPPENGHQWVDSWVIV